MRGDVGAARGAALPVGVLATAIAVDPSGGAGAVVAWLAFWPALATNLGAVSLILVTSAGPAAAAAVSIAWASATFAAAAALLRRRDLV